MSIYILPPITSVISQNRDSNTTTMVAMLFVYIVNRKVN